jgi:hypothetical protein
LLLNYALLIKMQDDACLSGGRPLHRWSVPLVHKKNFGFMRNKAKFSKGGRVSDIEVLFPINDSSMKAPATPTHISVL